MTLPNVHAYHGCRCSTTKKAHLPSQKCTSPRIGSLKYLVLLWLVCTLSQPPNPRESAVAPFMRTFGNVSGGFCTSESYACGPHNCSVGMLRLLWIPRIAPIQITQSLALRRPFAC